MVKVVMNVNDCLPFKMDAPELVHWAQEIDRLIPDVDPEAIRFLIDCFKTEDLIWDRNKGIQNMFLGLKRIRRDEDGKFNLVQSVY